MAPNGNNPNRAPAATEEPESLADNLMAPTLAIELERSQIDQQIATAHKYPRSIDQFIKAIGTMACYNESAAENCVYSLPRGGKAIIGPSIGFANIVAQAWGNNREGARITFVDRKEKTVHAEGAFLDLQTNHQTITPVQRRIVDSKGRLYNDDMIIVTGQAAASIARRNAILAAVPRALWFPVWQDALQIVRGTVETFAEHKDKALKAFHQFGVKADQVFMVLGLKGEPDLTLEHIPALRAMYSALRDGSATVEEMFDPRRMTGTGFEQVMDPLQDEAERTAGQQDTAQGQGEAPGKAPEEPGAKASGGAPAQSTAKPEEPKADKQATKGKGGGKGGTKAATTPKAAAKPEPAPAQQAATGEQAPVTPAPAPADQPQQEPQPEPPVEDQKPELTTCAEYEAYAMTYIAQAESAAALEQQWKSERGMRTSLSVVEDAFSRLHAAYSEKLATLKGPQS